MTKATDESGTCVILADSHTALVGQLRDLLQTVFEAVFTVANCQSLLEGVRRLDPGLIVVDIGFGGQGNTNMLGQLKTDVPGARIIVLSFYDHPPVAQAAMEQGVDAVVLKRRIGDDLLPAVDVVLSGVKFVSTCFEAGRLVEDREH
jgi:DNA-binding NarL/FixJ family response regulator